jgi:hypothetical protein
MGHGSIGFIEFIGFIGFIGFNGFIGFIRFTGFIFLGSSSWVHPPGFIFMGSWVRSEADLQCSRLATLPRPLLRGIHLCLLLQVSWGAWQSTVTSMGRIGRWGGHRGPRHGERLAVLRAARVSRTAWNSGSELTLAHGVFELVLSVAMMLDGLQGCVGVGRWSRGS